jgi:type IV secretion system protein VirD4
MAVEALLLGLLLFGAALATWYWASSRISAWFVSGRAPNLPLAMTVAALRRLPSHLSDPRAAWPTSVRAGLSGPLPFYACLAVIGVLMLVTTGFVAVIGFRKGAGHARNTGARWARRGDMRSILVRSAKATGRLVIGESIVGGPSLPGSLGSKTLATESRHSVLVLGPTQSGKTTGLAIPAILEWKGPVVATSVKDDLAATTHGWRSNRGPAWVFDPTGSSGIQPLARWSPLSYCGTWSDSQRTAGWLVDATPARSGMADAAFWYAAAAKQLAPLLLAAERAGLGMGEVAAWTDVGEFDVPLQLLELSGETDAGRALAACSGREERIRSSVSTTLETVLSPFEDPAVALATSESDWRISELLEGAGTLYLCGPSHEQQRVQSLFAALVSAVIAEAVRASNRARRPLDPPLLLVLDEAANIAPVRDLDTLASTGAGLGIQLVTVCQDLSQLVSRYGQERSRTIANNHRAKVLLSGVGDLATLDLVSGLVGEEATRQDTVTVDMTDGRSSRSSATVFRRLAPTDALRRLPQGEGLLVYGNLAPVRFKLRPWYRTRSLRRKVGSCGSSGDGAIAP